MLKIRWHLHEPKIALRWKHIGLRHCLREVCTYSHSCGFFLLFVLVYRTCKFMLCYPFLRHTITIMKVLTLHHFFCMRVWNKLSLSRDSYRLIFIRREYFFGRKVDILLFNIWYLCYVIEMGIRINNIKVTCISNQLHVFSPLFKIDANYSGYSFQTKTLDEYWGRKN